MNNYLLDGHRLVSTVPNHSTLCWTQGVLLNYFQLASTLWVDVIVWHLYRTVILGKSIRNNLKYHAISWGIPLLYIVLTLTTNDYGVSGGDDLGYCWVVDRPGFPQWTASFWEIIFFSIVWVSSLLIVTLIGSIVRKVRRTATCSAAPAAAASRSTITSITINTFNLLQDTWRGVALDSLHTESA